ncbi:MAG: ATP-dependent DNA helicase [Actinomycetota bacterium]|nr:ATP-dependent DNA helicase [Actinomycetota bacterium]MEC8970563.1 ATP-dependent DNA helicase [Actinomycetota bacterium]
MTDIPVLKGDAKRAVEHRGSHLQIIAAAGSGKTEIVSQRVSSLLAEDVDPRSIVAFTFTERAASELRERIELRAIQSIGPDALDRIGGLFIGTIHAFCFKLLQQYVPRYETYDVLDENQLTAFISREATRLEIKQLDPSGRNRLFASIQTFLQSVDVVENEILDPTTMPKPFLDVLLPYFETLDRYRLLTFGQQIVAAVDALGDPSIARSVHGDLRHLVVDEYQDVNPAQERLIEMLAGPDVEVCVVGDDDQSIYQWRGADVQNIVTFASRYPNVETFEITTNRRSRPQIIDAANTFATTIIDRLPKTMGTYRADGGPNPAIATWVTDREVDEASRIAEMILELARSGVPFRDIAVLVRGKAAFPALIEQFGTFNIPVQPGGRTGLFDQPDAAIMGRTFCWLTSVDWRLGFDRGELVDLEDLLDEFDQQFGLVKRVRNRLRKLLLEWQAQVPNTERTADLIGEFYGLLSILDIRSWDLDDPILVNRLGILARFSALLADYETVRRRARPDPDNPGEQVGGEDRGVWYYKNLAFHILNSAQGAFDGFDGEDGFAIDAVDLLTIHKAKGLEWPVVFVPSLTSRFPSNKVGREQGRLVPRDRYPAARYEGSDADERRLFYVAMTRARDWLSLSRHNLVKVQSTDTSPYWAELDDHLVDPGAVVFPEIIERNRIDDEPIMISFSELSLFIDCGRAYRLRTMIGFQPPIAPELGYGKAVHHVMRAIAEHTRNAGTVPDDAELDSLIDNSFFLPAANKPAHRNLKDAARRLINQYRADYSDDLRRVWETERPFELHLDGVTIIGRADVVLDREGGDPDSLAILDYKTSTDSDPSQYELQLQIYSDAGRREGLDVRGAYVHDLKNADRIAVDLSDEAIAGAEATVAAAADRLRSGDFSANPGDRCRRCDVRQMCASART